MPDVEGGVLAEEEGGAVIDLDGEGIAAFAVPEDARPEIPASIRGNIDLELRKALFELGRVAGLFRNRQS